MKNTLKIIFILIIIVGIFIIIRSLPKKVQNSTPEKSTEPTSTEQISPTISAVPTVQEKLDTPQDLLDRLESDSDIDYTPQINAIEAETN